jgi:hypothetical protein
MAIPSITMIPSGYKSEKVYSVLPTNGDGDLFFDRNTPATRVNKDGLIEQVGTDVPTLDYSDGSCPSLLSERYSLNLVTYSEDFSQGWIKNNSTVSTNQTTSPSGDLTADKFISDDTNQPRVEKSFTVPTTNKTYTFSVFVKKINTRYIALSRFSGGEGAIFDLDTKSVVSSSAENAFIKEMSNGWFRISITQTVLSTDSFNIWKINGTNGSFIGTGIVGDETFIWGAQLEEQRYATSYIPTTSETASRSGDWFSKTGLSSYISSTAGVLYAEIASLSTEDNSRRIFSLNDGGDINRVLIGFLSGGTTYVAINNQPVAYFTPTDPTDFHKVAIKYEDNNTKFFANGNQIGSTETTQTVPSGLSQIKFTSGLNSDRFYGKVKDLRVYNTLLTDLELQELTTI